MLLRFVRLRRAEDVGVRSDAMSKDWLLPFAYAERNWHFHLWQMKQFNSCRLEAHMSHPCWRYHLTAMLTSRRSISPRSSKWAQLTTKCHELQNPRRQHTSIRLQTHGYISFKMFLWKNSLSWVGFISPGNQLLTTSWSKSKLNLQ